MKPADLRWLRVLWMGTLVAVSAGLTASLTCVAPFVALSVAAAATLPVRQALLCTLAVWLANQAVGFAVLSYPWTPSTLEWGLAIGLATVAATLTAQWLLGRFDGARTPVRTVTAFAAAFAVYESLLAAVAVFLLGGAAAFAPSIIAQVLGLNAATLAGLWGLGWLLSLGSSTSPARLG